MTSKSLAILLSVLFSTLPAAGRDLRAVAHSSFPAAKATGDFLGATWNPLRLKIEPQTKNRKRRPARRRSKKYSTDLDALRAQFNKDSGKVRLLLLLSPT